MGKVMPSSKRWFCMDSMSHSPLELARWDVRAVTFTVCYFQAKLMLAVLEVGQWLLNQMKNWLSIWLIIWPCRKKEGWGVLGLGLENQALTPGPASVWFSNSTLCIILHMLLSLLPTPPFAQAWSMLQLQNLLSSRKDSPSNISHSTALSILYTNVEVTGAWDFTYVACSWLHPWHLSYHQHCSCPICHHFCHHQHLALSLPVY